jgi:hypothetical protein
MARQFPDDSEGVFNPDRRQLLSTVVSATAAGIVPYVKASEPILIETAQPPSPADEASSLNVCAVTARRLQEITRRNEIRSQAKLPLLSIATELRRMKERDDNEKFSKVFRSLEAEHSNAIWDEVLKPRRRVLGDPNWQPGFFEAIGYGVEVKRILRERFQAEHRGVHEFDQLYVRHDDQVPLVIQSPNDRSILTSMSTRKRSA